LKGLRHIAGFEHLLISIHGNQAYTFQLLRSHPIDCIDTAVTHSHHKDASRWAVLNVMLLFSNLLNKGRLTNDDLARSDDLIHCAL
jgi:hypothetical protein